jgi:hypothetical protein
MTATALQSKPTDLTLMVIAQDAAKLQRDPDDLAREMFGRTLSELTKEEGYRLSGRVHLLVMEADRGLKECAFCGAPTFTSKCIPCGEGKSRAEFAAYDRRNGDGWF